MKKLDFTVLTDKAANEIRGGGGTVLLATSALKSGPIVQATSPLNDS